jgi:dTDP-4-amino-4,6-dideoxygalactose transaminase
MRIGRTLSPVATPIGWSEIHSGLRSFARRESECRRFADELCKYLGKRHCYLFSSGRAALTVVLRALSNLYPDRDRVLIPAYCCYSVPAAIVRVGLKVVLCDVDEHSLAFDFRQLSSRLEDERLLCVVPAHLFGIPADVKRLRRMLDGRDVPIVEDAAQALGVMVDNSLLGTQGDIGLFSLGRGKPLTTVGGGILVTDDDAIAAEINGAMACLKQNSASELLGQMITALAIKLLGIPTLFWLPRALPFLRLGETVYDPGFPIRQLSGFQAGLSRGWQKRLASSWGQRRKNTEVWLETLPAGLFRPKLPGQQPDLLRFPVVCADETQRKSVLIDSAREGLGLAPGYPDSIDGIPALKASFSSAQYPVARRLARQLLTLPVHSYVSSEDQGKIDRLLKASNAALKESEESRYMVGTEHRLLD